MAKHVKALATYKSHREGKGCVIKCNSGWSTSHHGSYRYKCYEDTKSKSFPKLGRNGPAKKALYNRNFLDKWGHLHLKRIRRKGPTKSADWHIGSKVPDARGRTPYEKQASFPFRQNTHHILPATSLAEALKQQELKWLMKAEYNLNDGKNTIILPKTIAWADFLNLPDHPGGHRQYNRSVKKKVNDLKKKKSKQKGKCDLKEEDFKKLKKDLETWQDKQFGSLVLHGEKLAFTKFTNRVNSAKA